MSKATTASNGFGPISPSGKNALVKANLKSNCDIMNNDFKKQL